MVICECKKSLAAVDTQRAQFHVRPDIMPDLINDKRSTSLETLQELTSGTTVWNGPLEMATMTCNPGQILVSHPGDCTFR